VRMTRVLTIVAALAAAVCQPVDAQQMMRMLERGPVGYLHGQTLVQQTGNLTVGDFAHPAVADWNGDGRPDLIVGSGYGDLLLFAAGEEELFGPAQSLIPEGDVRLDAAPERRQVSPWVGDLDGDGELDLLLGLGDSVYRYRVVGGAPSEGVAVLGETGLPKLPGPVAPCAMDCNGDGTLDLVMTDGRGNVCWLPMGEGYGCQALTAAGAPITATPPARPCACDWDGDGTDDLLVGDGDGQVTLYRGSAVGLSAGEALGGSDVRWLPGGIAARAAAPWATDRDGDGDVDLLIGCRRGFVALVERLAPARLQVAGHLQQSNAPVDAGRCAVAAPGDWDGDGDVDLVVGGEDGFVTLFERLPGAGIVLARGRRIADAGGLVRAEAGDDEYLRYAAPALADWDADGDLDVLVGCGSGAVLVWENDSGLRAAGPVQVSGRRLTVGGIAMPAPHDANGDGDMDLYVGARALPGREFGMGEMQPPRLAPACAYFENIANAAGQPLFAKGVPVAMSLVSGGDSLRRDADFLAPYATWPGQWRGPGSDDFVTATGYGTFAFTNSSRRGAYARLELACLGRSLPSPLLPPLYWARPVQMGPGGGLMAADEAYGFVCYYPRELFPR